MIILHGHLHDLWKEAKMHMAMYWVGTGTTRVVQCIHEGDREQRIQNYFFLAASSSSFCGIGVECERLQ